MAEQQAAETRAYRWVSGYNLDWCADEYEVLFRPDGTKLARLTEPEDRNSYRDLAPITDELNRLLDALDAAEARTDEGCGPEIQSYATDNARLRERVAALEARDDR
jgi:hypothetical protein